MKWGVYELINPGKMSISNLLLLHKIEIEGYNTNRERKEKLKL